MIVPGTPGAAGSDVQPQAQPSPANLLMAAAIMKDNQQNQPMPEKGTGRSFPTDEDTGVAMESGGYYGTPEERYAKGYNARILGKEGKKGFQPQSAVGMDTEDTLENVMKASKVVDMPKNPELVAKMHGVYSQASLAVRRSAIASIGWDPRQMVIDIKTGKANLAGEYDPKSDTILSLGKPSNLVHESLHRGIEKLRNTPEGEQAMKGLKGVSDESIVRYIMATKMGDPELGTGDVANKQRASAISSFEGLLSRTRQGAIADLEALAARQLSHQGGPR